MACGDGKINAGKVYCGENSPFQNEVTLFFSKLRSFRMMVLVTKVSGFFKITRFLDNCVTSVC